MYTRDMYYDDINRIMYSRYYSALNEKQKIDMQRAITALRERGFQGDIVKHILDKKESSLI